MVKARTMILAAVVLIAVMVPSGGPGYGSSRAEAVNGVRAMALGDLRIALSSGGVVPRRNSSIKDTPAKPKINSLYGRSFKKYSRYSFSYSGDNFRVGYYGLGASNLLKRDLQGEPTGETFNYRNHGLSGSVGGEIGDFGVGLQANGFYKGAEANSYGLSLTPALDYRIKYFRAGVILPTWEKRGLMGGNNAGGSWKEEITLGFGILRGRLNLGLDFTLGLAGDVLSETNYRAGVEWWIMDYFALRGGLNGRSEKSFGFGIKGGKVRINYAYTFHSELPASSVVSFGWVFGDK